MWKWIRKLTAKIWILRFYSYYLKDITILNLKNATCDLQGYLRTSTIHLPQALSDAKQKALDNFLVHIKDLSSMFHSIESVKAIFKSRTCLSQARSDFLLLDLKIIKKKVKDFSCTAKLFQKFDELIEPLFSSEDLISDIGNFIFFHNWNIWKKCFHLMYKYWWDSCWI